MMAMETTPLSNLHECSAKAAPSRLPLHYPVTPTRTPPVVGKAQQVKCPWWLATAGVGLVGVMRWTTEGDEARLVRMQGQTVLAESFRQYRQDPPGVFFTSKTHDE